MKPTDCIQPPLAEIHYSLKHSTAATYPLLPPSATPAVYQWWGGRRHRLQLQSTLVGIGPSPELLEPRHCEGRLSTLLISIKLVSEDDVG